MSDYWFHYGWTQILVREICMCFEVKIVEEVKQEKFQRAYLSLLCLDVNCLNLYLKVLLKINFVELFEYSGYLHIKINTQIKKKIKDNKSPSLMKDLPIKKFLW